MFRFLREDTRTRRKDRGSNLWLVVHKPSLVRGMLRSSSSSERVASSPRTLVATTNADACSRLCVWDRCSPDSGGRRDCGMSRPLLCRVRAQESQKNEKKCLSFFMGKSHHTRRRQHASTVGAHNAVLVSTSRYSVCHTQQQLSATYVLIVFTRLAVLSKCGHQWGLVGGRFEKTVRAKGEELAATEMIYIV